MRWQSSGFACDAESHGERSAATVDGHVSLSRASLLRSHSLAPDVKQGIGPTEGAPDAHLLLIAQLVELGHAAGASVSDTGPRPNSRLTQLDSAFPKHDHLGVGGEGGANALLELFELGFSHLPLL